MTDNRVRHCLALGIGGLYVVVTLSLLVYCLASPSSDMAAFFEKMEKANFLLAPVGFVMGYYFSRSGTKE